jgi:hypothetical protein
LTAPTFDTLDSGPCYTAITASAMNYRSTV